MWVILLALIGQTAEPTCIDRQKTICGFHCVESKHGKVCARTPYGTCQSMPNENICWDPPAHLSLFAKAARPACENSFGRSACGYGCRSFGAHVACGLAPGATCHPSGDGIVCGFGCKQAFGELRCAQTPLGVCATAGGTVECFDPAPELFLRYGAELRQPSCVTTGSTVACGYGCAVRAGEARCALTPERRCEADSLRIVCF
jgi:hypothetical protein